MSSSSSTGMFDVFLSFRGSETRNIFISYLRRSLVNMGIRVFDDLKAIPSQKLEHRLNVIGGSKIAVVVISENYASSRWCLEELVEILKFQRRGSLMVLPVYYGANPIDIRRQARNMGQILWKGSPDTDRSITWSKALLELSSIKGEDIKNWREAAELLDKILEFIWEKLNVSGFSSLVGMDLHMKRMYELLSLESELEEVREIGICGPVGIGKTMLARCVYQHIRFNFGVRVLVEDIKRVRQDLQSKLNQASNRIMFDGDKAALEGQRVLLVADGVDTIEQIEILRKHTRHFGPGSRVIVTCTDKHLLLACGIEHLYQVKPMTSSEAIQLFCNRAFNQIRPPKGFEELSDRAVKFAGGLPLLISAFGSELFGRSYEEWETVLSRYEQSSYDVVLSFRGSDTRRTFVSHLHRSLVEEGIRIFSDEMQMNPHPSEAHLNFIGRSKVAVIVVSANYASSSWCLEELTEILKFRLKGSLTVIPVYYGVNPSYLQRLAGSLSQQFGRLLKEYPNKLKRWSESLAELSSIIGEDSSNWKTEVELIKKITDDIWDRLSVFGFSGLVGMDLHMERMYELLSLESEVKKIRELGICGSVGIGKTMLARYVHQQICSYFDVHVLVEDIDEIHHDLHSKLNQALNSSRITFGGGIAALESQKVLLVADGVGNIEQIEILRKHTKHFGPGSRLIVTCTDKHLVHAGGIEHLYQVKPMASSEALQLFCNRAFKQIRPPIGFEKLSDRAIKFAGGIPLVIAAVGSELFGRFHEEWEMLLSRYEQSSSDEDTKGIEKRVFDVSQDSNVSDVSKVSGKSKKEWILLVSEYDQLSGEGTSGREIRSFGASNSEDMSLTGKHTTFICVGLDCQLQAVIRLMDLESDNEVHIVGIWGVGGVGKTNLARCVCEETMQHFHTHVFLENVGKIYQDHGTSRVGEEILWENIQKSFKNESDGTKSRLRDRKVLLIVDGVDDNEQIEDVQKVAMWFGAGSRVIVTTRDENLLVDNGVKHVYKVKCLKVHEALQLFYQFAFKQQTPSTRFKQLSVRAVQLAGCIPLALEVLGSFLYGKSENDWESVLQKLEKQQHTDIVEVAKPPSDVGVRCKEKEDDEDLDHEYEFSTSPRETVWLTIQRLKPLLWGFVSSIIVVACIYAIDCVLGIGCFTGRTYITVLMFLNAAFLCISCYILLQKTTREECL